MGAEPWQYFVSYDKNIEAALEALRNCEFEAGHYRGSELGPSSIEEALTNVAPEGTASILDILWVSERPELCSVSSLSTRRLRHLFGTDRPTREMVLANQDFYDDIDRGCGIYIIVYEADVPSAIFFAGYSAD